MQLRETIHQLGWREGLLYFLGRSMEAISGGRWRLVRYFIYSQPVSIPASPASDKPDGNGVERVTGDDPVCADFPRAKEIIKQRFENGYVCLVARVKGRFAGFLWYACQAYEEDEVRCRFELSRPGESVWDFDVYVAQEFRLGRTFTRLWEAANTLLYRDGKRASYSRIAPSNTKSLAAHQRLGAQRIATLSFVCFGRHQFMVKSGARIHYSNSPTTRPTTLLPAGIYGISAEHMLFPAELLHLAAAKL